MQRDFWNCGKLESCVRDIVALIKEADSDKNLRRRPTTCAKVEKAVQIAGA